MTDTTLPGVLLHGVAASRPAASAVAKGTIYSATDTGAITQSDGVSTWATYATISASGMTNPMSAVGDMIQGTTAGAPAALVAPLAGKVLTGAGVTTSLAYKYPPGYEIDYVEITSPVSVTATSAATADTCITGSAITYDGSTIIMVQFFAPYVTTVAASAAGWLVELYDGATNIGAFEQVTSQTSVSILRMGASGSRRLTPSNASHTYSIRMWTTTAGTASFGAGAGGAGNYLPAFIRITKVSGGA